MDLCDKRVIPQQFVNEYKKFAVNNDVPDALAESDMEEQTDEEN